jgi:hypothetical protein
MDRLDTPLIFICLLKKTWFFSWGYTSLNQPVCLASLNRKSQIDMDFLMELQSIINHIKTLEIRTKVSLCFYISLSTISPQNMAGYIYIYIHTLPFFAVKNIHHAFHLKLFVSTPDLRASKRTPQSPWRPASEVVPPFSRRPKYAIFGGRAAAANGPSPRFGCRENL